MDSNKTKIVVGVFVLFSFVATTSRGKDLPHQTPLVPLSCSPIASSAFTMAADFSSTTDLVHEVEAYAHQLSSVENALYHQIDQIDFQALQGSRNLNQSEKAQRQTYRDSIEECGAQVNLASERAARLYWDVLALRKQ